MPIGPEQNSSRFFIENVSTPPLPLDTQFTYPMVQFVTLVNLAMWLSYRNVLRFSTRGSEHPAHGPIPSMGRKRRTFL